MPKSANTLPDPAPDDWIAFRADTPAIQERVSDLIEELAKLTSDQFMLKMGLNSLATRYWSDRRFSDMTGKWSEVAAELESVAEQAKTLRESLQSLREFSRAQLLDAASRDGGDALRRSGLEHLIPIAVRVHAGAHHVPSRDLSLAIPPSGPMIVNQANGGPTLKLGQNLEALEKWAAHAGKHARHESKTGGKRIPFTDTWDSPTLALLKDSFGLSMEVSEETKLMQPIARVVHLLVEAEEATSHWGVKDREALAPWIKRVRPFWGRLDEADKEILEAVKDVAFFRARPK